MGTAPSTFQLPSPPRLSLARRRWSRCSRMVLSLSTSQSRASLSCPTESWLRLLPHCCSSPALGLCGDMNGERSADLKTPGMCVMRPHLAALSYLINKSGSASGFERCSGIPTTLKTEFETESAHCARETVIPTPVSILAERISILNRPVGMTHVVEKQSTKLCISKQMVKTCLSKPLSIKQKSVEFSCVSHPSMLSRSLEKRALAGESLIQEIGQLPTVFRKVEFEPVACKSEMSSISL